MQSQGRTAAMQNTGMPGMPAANTGMPAAGMPPGMPQGAPAAYKQGSFGKMNAGRIQSVPMQALQMQQQQLQDVSSEFIVAS